MLALTFTRHGSWWWRVVTLMEAAGRRVIMPTLIGMEFGETQFPENPLSTWADQIADALRKEIEPVTLVGHSRVPASELCSRSDLTRR